MNDFRDGARWIRRLHPGGNLFIILNWTEVHLANLQAVQSIP